MENVGAVAGAAQGGENGAAMDKAKPRMTA
jgi:hypothetical protein